MYKLTNKRSRINLIFCAVLSSNLMCFRPALLALRDAFVSARTDFAGFEQHDAQEFLSFYFESLQREAAEFIGRREIQ